jgi:hypothetical protein
VVSCLQACCLSSRKSLIFVLPPHPRSDISIHGIRSFTLRARGTPPRYPAFRHVARAQENQSFLMKFGASFALFFLFFFHPKWQPPGRKSSNTSFRWSSKCLLKVRSEMAPSGHPLGQDKRWFCFNKTYYFSGWRVLRGLENESLFGAVQTLSSCRFAEMTPQRCRMWFSCRVHFISSGPRKLTTFSRHKKYGIVCFTESKQ